MCRKPLMLIAYFAALPLVLASDALDVAKLASQGGRARPRRAPPSQEKLDTKRHRLNEQYGAKHASRYEWIHACILFPLSVHLAVCILPTLPWQSDLAETPGAQITCRHGTSSDGWSRTLLGTLQRNATRMQCYPACGLVLRTAGLLPWLERTAGVERGGCG